MSKIDIKYSASDLFNTVLVERLSEDLFSCFTELKEFDHIVYLFKSNIVKDLIQKSVPALILLFTKYIDAGLFDEEISFRIKSNESKDLEYDNYLAIDIKELIECLYFIGPLINTIRKMDQSECTCRHYCYHRQFTDTGDSSGGITDLIYQKCANFILSWTYQNIK